MEFIEALDIQNHVSEDDVQSIIDENAEEEKPKELKYSVMKEKLFELIKNIKKVPFKNLVNQHFSLPVDRVSRFMDMLQDEFKSGILDDLSDYFLNELKFA